MQLVPFRQLPGTCKLVHDDKPILWEASTKRHGAPLEAGYIVDMVWAESSKEARKIMESIFPKSQFTTILEVAKIRVRECVWKELKNR